MKYRAEIDGLRALAVMPVILFHAGFEWFSGGFVGVDVFFVISGYLITTIIISEMAEGKFSIVNFYERRARRILPALFLVMATCLPAAWLLMLPNQLKGFGDSLSAVSLFVSNFQFWLGSGYFAEGQTSNPLLHTWSLAVEEQFYIFSPVFLLLTWRLGVAKFTLLLALIFLLSFGIANWAVFFGWHQKISSGAFFLIPARAWELLAGSFLSIYLTFYAKPFEGWRSQLLSAAGLTLLIISIVSFDQTTPFPSFYTLLPVLGTAFLVLSGSESFVQKILKTPVFVGVGLISYSAYLWHQPIFAFSHIMDIPSSTSIYLILIALSLGLAYLSWRYVEAPFRNRSKISKKRIFQYSLSAIATFVSLGLLLSTNNGFESRSPNYVRLSELAHWPIQSNKTEDCLKRYGGDQYCIQSNGQFEPTHLLLGDSHANHFFYGVKSLVPSEQGANLLMTGAGGCPPLIDIDMGYTYVHGTDLKCHIRTSERYENLVRSEAISDVFLAFDEAGLFDRKIKPVDLRAQIDFEGNRYRAVKSAIERTVDEWSKGGARVWIIEDIPDVEWGRFQRCVWSQDSIDRCSDALVFQNQNDDYARMLDELEANGYFVLRTRNGLVDQRLVTGDGSQLFFRDATHLTKYGSEKIFENRSLLLEIERQLPSGKQ